MKTKTNLILYKAKLLGMSLNIETSFNGDLSGIDQLPDNQHELFAEFERRRRVILFKRFFKNEFFFLLFFRNQYSRLGKFMYQPMTLK